jgi:hypothetical protein
VTLAFEALRAWAAAAQGASEAPAIEAPPEVLGALEELAARGHLERRLGRAIALRAGGSFGYRLVAF